MRRHRTDLQTVDLATSDNNLDTHLRNLTSMETS